MIAQTEMQKKEQKMQIGGKLNFKMNFVAKNETAKLYLKFIFFSQISKIVPNDHIYFFKPLKTNFTTFENVITLAEKPHCPNESWLYCFPM